MNKSARIYITGHTGMVGSAIQRELQSRGYTNCIGRSSRELDLRDQSQVHGFFEREKPHYVFLAAAKVGGILANATYPAQFIYDNLAIAGNVIHASYKQGVKKLIFFGSSCIYPRLSPQPIKEEYLLTGPLEPTNEPYAIAKIAGLKMCEAYNREYKTDFISVMPTNLYGPKDNFDLETAHVLPAMIRKFHEAHKSGQKNVTLWGTGKPKREFLHVDDLARACIHIMNSDEACPELLNIGSGQELSIAELARIVQKLVGYGGNIRWDHSKPDGTPRKVLDVSRIWRLGWTPQISLQQGLKDTVQWFADNYGKKNE